MFFAPLFSLILESDDSVASWWQQGVKQLHQRRERYIFLLHIQNKCNAVQCVESCVLLAVYSYTNKPSWHILYSNLQHTTLHMDHITVHPSSVPCCVPYFDYGEPVDEVPPTHTTPRNPHFKAPQISEQRGVCCVWLQEARGHKLQAVSDLADTYINGSGPDFSWRFSVFTLIIGDAKPEFQSMSCTSQSWWWLQLKRSNKKKNWGHDLQLFL